MKKLINPNLFHGKNKKTNFFEGWYYKIINKNGRTFAFIPGISLGEKNDSSHSFIQVLDGNNIKYDYLSFPKEYFFWNDSPFSITVENSNFNLSNLSVDLNFNGISLNGYLDFHNLKFWEDSFINPGSMGFYNYIPNMECYSHVCAIDGSTSGSITLNGELIDFTDGKVYIEKNWGKSFPTEWLWVQCNSFSTGNASITCSLGEIPFPLRNFRGFLIAVSIGDKFYKFTTMNGSKITLKYLDNNVEVKAKNRSLLLTFRTFTEKDSFILCNGPNNGTMAPLVDETLTGKIFMKLEDIKTGMVLFKDWGDNVGVEYGGNLMNMLKNT